MSATDQQQAKTAEQDDRSWLDGEVDGRPVRFWVGLGLAIAAVTLGFGAWWVWGLDRGMPMGDGAGSGMEAPMDTGGEAPMDEGMAGMPTTEARLPPVAGLYDGEQVFFVHPEVSGPDVAEVLTGMMGGSPVLVVPELADVSTSARDEVYVFANGIEGAGPLGFQPDVLPSAPGDDAYRPLRTVVLVTWVDEGRARMLSSADEITAAADAGDVLLETTDVVVNMPFLTWPGGQR